MYLAWLRVTAANQEVEAQIRQAWSTTRQADPGPRKLVADVFNQAVGQLRDDKLEIRLFAIYNIWQIAEDYPDYRRTVVELLTAYVRQRPAEESDAGVLPVDVAQILRIVSQNPEPNE